MRINFDRGLATPEDLEALLESGAERGISEKDWPFVCVAAAGMAIKSARSDIKLTRADAEDLLSRLQASLRMTAELEGPGTD